MYMLNGIAFQKKQNFIGKDMHLEFVERKYMVMKKKTPEERQMKILKGLANIMKPKKRKTNLK